MNKYTISISQGGLSNRIKCLISSMKIADKTKRKILLYWSKDKYCNCYFNNLFNNKIEEMSKENLEKIIKSKDFEYYGISLNKIKDSRRFIIIDNTALSGFTNKDIYLIYDKISEEIKKEIIFYLKKLEIKKEILKIVNSFSKKKFNKNTIGVHIRKGDFVWLKSGIGNVSNEDKFIEEMKNEIKENPKANFFLATEDNETENKLKGIFGEKIINYPKNNYEREKEGSVKEALIELLLLSKTKKIFGTFGSTFTETAWYFGNCKQEVKIIVDREYLKKFLENKRKQEGLTNNIKKFIYKLFVQKSRRLLRVLVK